MHPILLSTLLYRHIYGGVCHPYFGSLTLDEIKEGSVASRQYSPAYYNHPVVVNNTHNPHCGFNCLARLPILKINTTRVVLADYALLRQDFPALWRMQEREIDAWLLERTSWVHRDTLNIVVDLARHIDVVASKTPPNASRTSAIALRSMLIQVDAHGDGLMESKGSGAEKPSLTKLGWQQNLRDGLSTLHDRITEFVHDKLVNMFMKKGRLATTQLSPMDSSTTCWVEL
jgi:hypothetical protein